MFENKIMALAEQSKAAIKDRSSERATDTYVIQPFIRALGYDTSNPEEVKPEFYADIGTKKGEKVDYALLINNAPVIIIEIKAITESLNSHHHSQLFRYFTTTDVRIAILTNGREAWFYSDLNKTNVMDDTPFFKFDFQDNLPEDRIFLENFYRNKFQINEITREASMRKDLQKVKAYIQNHVINPSDEFIRFIGKEINGGMPRKDMIEPLKASIISAFKEISGTKTTEYAHQTNNQIFSQKPEFKHENETQNDGFSAMHVDAQKFIVRSQTREIYEKYRTAIKKLGNDISDSVERRCIVFHINNKNIVSIIPRSEYITIALNIKKITDIVDDRNICEDKTGDGHYGSGNVVVQAKEMKDFDYIMGLVQQVYNLISQESIVGRQASNHTAFTNFTHEKPQTIQTMPSSIQGTWLEKYYHPNYRRFIHQEPVKSLFEQYIMEMKKLGDEKIHRTHVAYHRSRGFSRNNYPFSAIQDYAQGIRIWLDIEGINEIHDPRGICNVVGFNESGVRKKHTGIGQVFILVTKDSDHNYIMELVKQVYDKKA